MATETEFVTHDLWLASAISATLHFIPVLKKNSGLVEFVFPNSPALQDAISNYYNGATLSVIGYADTVKRLRHLMHVKKGGPDE